MSQFLWTQKQDIGPAGRSSAAMGFDSKEGRAVLFGGLTAGGLTDDTWQWDGNNWTQFADTGPSPRSDHAMAYDSARERMVLFGGGGVTSSGNTFNGETWEWDGKEWTQIEDTGPPPRSGMGMCYDSKRGLVVLFGGNNASVQFNDTWVWDGTSWTQEDDAGPSKRTKHGMDYDVVRDRVVLFGGLGMTTKQITVSVRESNWWGGSTYHNEIQTVTMYQFLDDTWEYDGTTWTRVEDIGPAGRYSFGFAYGEKVCLLFGGKDGSNSFRDSWQWNGSHWTQRQDMGPAARAAVATAYDSTRKRLVVFGGLGAGTTPVVFGDTWEALERP